MKEKLFFFLEQVDQYHLHVRRLLVITVVVYQCLHEIYFIGVIIYWPDDSNRIFKNRRGVEKFNMFQGGPYHSQRDRFRLEEVIYYLSI